MVPLDADATWDLLLDIERVAVCFPGASLTEVDGDSFSGAVGVRLGPISLTYQGTAQFVSKDPGSHSALIEARGKESGGAGGAGADVRLSLSTAGPKTTKVSVDTDLSITGRPAQFGRGAIAEVSDQLLKQFTKNLEAQLLASGDASSPAAASAEATADSPGMASIMLRVLSRRAAPWLVGAAGAIAAVLVIRRFRPAR